MTERVSDEQRQRMKELITDCGKFMLSVNDERTINDSITEKSGDSNFVTDFDVEVQRKLISGLLEIFPDAVFLAEEKDNSELDTKNGRCFIIDPIDGTTNFIHRLNTSAISVGMLYDGSPYFGAIYDPYRDEYFDAVDSCGAYMNGKKICVSEKELDAAVISFGTVPYYKSEYADISFERAKEIFMHCSDIRRSESAAIDIANVACGKLEGFFEFTLSPWDYTAGSVIVKEAGGIMSSFDTNSVNYEKPSSMLCSNRVTYNKLIEILGK